jgi:YbbR domain-containing protein
MKKLLTENLGLKISAVLFSIFLWFFVTSRGQSEIALDIPLEFKNVPADIGIVTTSVKTVSVTVRGQERPMKNLKASDVRVYVDLEKAKKGEGIFYINAADITLPYALSAMNVTPSSVKVKLDETVSRTVTVTPVVTGEPRDGFVMRSIKVEPKSIVIKGLKFEIRKLRSVKTEPLDITDLDKTITQEVKIDAGGGTVTPALDTATVTITITER